VQHELDVLRLPAGLAYPQYTGVNSFRKPIANSNYQSFILSADHRFHNGLSALVSFTASKLLDDASQVVSYTGPAGTKQDAYCRKCEKSVSSQDVPKRLVISSNYELPFGKGRKFMPAAPKPVDFVLGGWQSQRQPHRPIGLEAYILNP
jgi:hypothetical protein